MGEGFGTGAARRLSLAIAASALLASQPWPAWAQEVPAPPEAAVAPAHDGQHDFDFAIGSWKVHLRALAHPLTGVTEWIEYDGTTVMRKIIDDRANLEEFDVDSPAAHRRIHAQTLRLYNPTSHQWNLYLVDAAKGTLGLPATVGQFTDGLGQFYDQEEYNGRMILVRYEWFNISPRAARMEQAFSIDGGKSWETNWICDLSR